MYPVLCLFTVDNDDNAVYGLTNFQWTLNALARIMNKHEYKIQYDFCMECYCHYYFVDEFAIYFTLR